ncbi:hypothetical protein, partial [Bradyrhizobium sp.]|uniref:hypothetical protein n=1 Tax=Bradyrhizobium sp. TaxID=376 RepID=UPI003C51CE97
MLAHIGELLEFELADGGPSLGMVGARQDSQHDLEHRLFLPESCEMTLERRRSSPNNLSSRSVAPALRWAIGKRSGATQVSNASSKQATDLVGATVPAKCESLLRAGNQQSSL